MKALTVTLLLMGITSFGHAQDYMDEIAEKACGCMDDLPADVETNEMTLTLGLCVFEAASPYKKKISRDYDINLEDGIGSLEGEGQKLGEIVGVRMVTVCPETLMKIVDHLAVEEVPPPVEEYLVEFVAGEVISVEKDLFVTFKVKDESGKTQKFYWLPFIESNMDLSTEYMHLDGMSVEIFYEDREFFDPRIDEYSMFSVISKLIVLEN